MRLHSKRGQGIHLMAPVSVSISSIRFLMPFVRNASRVGLADANFIIRDRLTANHMI